MGVAKELFELGFKKVSKATMNFLETGVPRTDHAGIIRAATNSPQEVTEYLGHIENLVTKGDQSGVLPMIQSSDKWNNEGVEVIKQANVLELGTTKDPYKTDLSWVGDRKSSELSRTGFRKNVLDFGYDKRLQNPDIPPSEISQAFKEEMGTMSYAGEQQKVLSGGSKPTKTGQRRLAVQDVAENKARRQKNIQERNEHGYTSPEAKKSYNKQNKEVAAENKQAVKDAKAQGIKVKPGQQFVSLEHDIALSHGKKWWQKVGNIGNDPANLFIQRDQLARQFKDNIENWFYPKSKDFVIKSDRSNLKDLIIMNVETGEEVLTIPMPADFKTGIPDNIIQQLNKLIGK